MRAPVQISLMLFLSLLVGRVFAQPYQTQGPAPRSFTKSHNDNSNETLTLDNSWTILDQYMNTGDYFAGSWTFTSNFSVVLQVTDLYAISDQFEVYDNGTLIETTPSVPDQPGGENISDPDLALYSGLFSNGVVLLPPGTHSITIRDIHIPLNIYGSPYPDGTVAFRVSRLWGARVAVTLRGDSTPIEDSLVCCDGTNIYLSGDIDVADDGSVTVNDSYPLSSIDHIALADPSNQSGPTVASIANKYIVLGASSTPKSNSPYRTVSLSLLVANTYGVAGWSYTIDSTGIGDDGFAESQQVKGLYAIPYVGGTNPPLSSIKAALNAAATSNGQRIPPHILYGLAQQESPGWLQFSRGHNVISHDGGIGIGQITGATAIWDSYLGTGTYYQPNPPPVPNTLSQLFGLSSDYTYNVKATAKVLWSKYNHMPDFDDNNPLKLESWYYALWGYNGYAKNNNPNTSKKAPYQEAVLKVIASNPIHMWMPVNILFPKYSDLGTDGEPDDLPYTPAPYHIATDFLGNVTTTSPQFGVVAKLLPKSLPGTTSVSLTVTNPISNGMAAGHVNLSKCTLQTSDGNVDSININPLQLNIPSGGTGTYTVTFNTISTPSGVDCSVSCWNLVLPDLTSTRISP